MLILSKKITVSTESPVSDSDVIRNHLNYVNTVKKNIIILKFLNPEGMVLL
jgi:hypothetical protein